MNTYDHRGSHDHRGASACAVSAAAACGARATARIRRRELAALAAASSDSPSHGRMRCPALRSRPGYLADLGSCWYSRVGWTPVVWRLEGRYR